MNTTDLPGQDPEQGASTEVQNTSVDALFDRTEDYNDAVGGMLAQLEHKSKKMSRAEAIDQLWDGYVEGQAEDDPDLAEFCGVMLRGPQDKEYSDRVNAFGDRKRTGNTLNRQEREDEYAMKYALVESNHTLRDMIAKQPGAFKRQKLMQWYSAFTKDVKYAEGSVDGAYSEIAVFEAAAHSQDTLRNVRYGTVEDDLRGGDIMATYVTQTEAGAQYTPVSIDVKAGKQVPTGSVKRDSLHVVVGVPTHMFDGHGHVGGEERDGIEKLIELGLGQAYAQAAAEQRSA